MAKPKIFIGSSVEGLSVAYAIQENLKFVTESTVWDQGVFNLSESSLESLIKVLEESDFGIFVFTPDDYIKIRGKSHLAVRDNVLFELGLFVGRLGRNRAFIVIPDNKDFHLPTDLIGMTPGKYEAVRVDKNLQAGTGSVSHKIREQINKLGSFDVSNEEPENSNPVEPVERKGFDDWFVALYFDKDYEKASAILQKRVRNTKDIDERIRLRCELCYIEFKKDAIKGNRQYEKVIADYPENDIGYISYATNLYHHNSFIKALDVVDEGLKKVKRKNDLFHLKAECLWAISKRNEAIELLESILLADLVPRLILKLADFYIELENKTAASVLLKQSYLTFPNDELIKAKFARLSYDNNQKEISILLYNELLIKSKKNPTYWCLLGNSYLDLELHNLALTAYEKAAEYSDQNQGWIYDNIGNLYNNKQLYDKAEENLKKALSLYDKSDYTYNRLSSVYLGKQNEQKKFAEIIAKAKAQINEDEN